MHPNISNFFTERKADWLKKKIKSSQTPEQQEKLEQEANEKFSLAHWLPDAAKRASQLAMVSHPSKFSHPSAKTSSVIAKNQAAQDGYVRTGNVEYVLDVSGNAAAMDVYKFLDLQMEDDKTVLAHLEEDSGEIKKLFNLPGVSYEDLKAGLTSVKQSNNQIKTDVMVKQVYFPVADHYHLLSLLTPSGLLMLLKNKIDAMRFSEDAKKARELRKDNKYHANGYEDLFNLTVTGFGGSKPQNVSVLNATMHGKAYLLSSLPPKIKKRYVSFPTTNFFKNSLYLKKFNQSFQYLNKYMRTDQNNMKIRQQIQHCIASIIDQVLHVVFELRKVEKGWSQQKQYQSLPQAQRVWLDEAYCEQRINEDEWLSEIVRDFARWMIGSYKMVCKEHAVKLSDYELNDIKDRVRKKISDDQEFFR